MSANAHDVTPEHLGLMLHRLLMDIQIAALDGSLDAKDVARVTDLAELIPLQFIHRDEDYLEIIVSGVRELALTSHVGRRMASVLNLSRDEVVRTLVPNHGRTLATA